MIDTGFADRSMIPVLLRRIRLRTAVSNARASVDALADLLDQQREPLRRYKAPLPNECISLPCGDEEGGVGGATVDFSEGDALREDELLEGVKLIAQLLDRIDVSIRHGKFSSGGEPEVTPACDAAHRLSGGAK